MADITVTAANVAAGSGARYRTVTAGATITAGQSVYRDPTTNTYKLADADASQTTARVVGVALDSASSGQPLTIQIGGKYTAGGTVVVGTVYVQSGTAGGICPAADLASGDYATVIGVGVTSTLIKLGIVISDVQVP